LYPFKLIRFFENGNGWENGGLVTMYYNPKGCKLTSDPLRWEEVCVRKVEEEIRKSMQAWTEKNRSTVVLTYGGLTDIYPRIDNDGVSIIFWEDNLSLPDSNPTSNIAAYIIPYFSLRWEGGRARGRITETSIVLDSLDFSENDMLSGLVAHEVGHVLGVGHPDHGVHDVSIMGLHHPWVISLPQPSDIRAIEYLYPFTEECAPIINLDDYSFSIEIWLPSEGRVVADLVYRVSHDQREYVEVTGIKPATSNKSCALKMGANGDLDQLTIPFIYLGKKMYKDVLLEVIPNTGRLTLLSASEA
jgi:hypothetical protein